MFLQPVLLGGANIKVSGGIDAFRQLADASQYAVALTSNAKVWNDSLLWSTLLHEVKNLLQAMVRLAYLKEHQAGYLVEPGKFFVALQTSKDSYLHEILGSARCCLLSCCKSSSAPSISAVAL